MAQTVKIDRTSPTGDSPELEEIAETPALRGQPAVRGREFLGET